ncbi:MAG: hypothetical protein WAL26_01410, partial [Mycobacterium sp.]
MSGPETFLSKMHWDPSVPSSSGGRAVPVRVTQDYRLIAGERDDWPRRGKPHSRTVRQAPDFETGQLRPAVEYDPAKLTHNAVEPAGQVFEVSVDVAALGGQRHRED